MYMHAAVFHTFLAGYCFYSMFEGLSCRGLSIKGMVWGSSGAGARGGVICHF